MNIEVTAKKKYGQNFLHDKNILNNIVSLAQLDNDTLCIEIGPGTGNLTEFILNKAKHALLFEIDESLISILNNRFKEYKNYTLINKDILEVSIDDYVDINLYKKIVVCANLPYYITTPIIYNLITSNICFDKMIFLVQDEVANRIVATKGKEYSYMSVLCNFFCKTKKCFIVKKESFTPIPKVTSAVIKLDIIKDRINIKNKEYFIKFIKQIFTQKRKTLMNNLQLYYNKEKILKLYEHFNLDKNVRSEELDVNKIYELSSYMEEI